MSKQTPGPWSIEPAWSERCGGDVAIVNRNHMGADWDICTVHSTEANAHLIAAAPEMLDVLRRCEALLLAYDLDAVHGDSLATEHLGAIRGVIAKATGAA